MSEHKAYGCDCTACRHWRLGIYGSGHWPRPRQYNGEMCRQGCFTPVDTDHVDASPKGCDKASHATGVPPERGIR